MKKISLAFLLTAFVTIIAITPLGGKHDFEQAGKHDFEQAPTSINHTV